MENTTEQKGLQLSDLKVANLPELQGWKEKQEALVAENPFIDVTDNKSYEVACKSRTALLKGRTALEGQEKIIASTLASFRKEVGTETKKLIAITQPSEEKQQTEVKRYEGVKEAEKEAERVKEQARVDGIKAKIDEFETESLNLIQGLTFGNIQGTKDALNLLGANASGFDFEEFDVLLESVKARNQIAFDSKLADVQEKEYQRVENERLAQVAKESKEKADLQAKRLKEIFPYIAFGNSVDVTTLWSLDKNEYHEILEAKIQLAMADAKQKEDDQKAIDDAKAETERKAKDEADKVFEIRKNRLLKIRFGLNEEFDRFDYLDAVALGFYTVEQVKNADAIDFETMITDAELAVEKLKSDKDAEAKEKEIAKQEARFNQRKQSMIDLGFVYHEDGEFQFTSEGLEPIVNLERDNDEDFYKFWLVKKEEVISLVHRQNAARIENFTSDKKLLTEFVDGICITHELIECQNEESKLFMESVIEKLVNFKKELYNQIENL